jgi:hypothetical protein
MTHILLTGAGFSYNWGGYLAKEAFDYLLGVAEHDDDLRALLWADQAQGLGFESTLARLRKAYEENYSPRRTFANTPPRRWPSVIKAHRHLDNLNCR